ncbi:MAG TPA: dienelactone hydrolase family protein [Candidatus Caenarcaniphilales bacterium]|nr:dienelactone hydrolase family protein [Candidatus Caenarcaniphilales bacterium]
MIEFPGVPNPTRDDAPEPGLERGYLAMPASGNGPGVLVLHAWWGLNDVIRGICQGLASEGFVALAPDAYGDGGVATTIEEAERRSESLDVARAEQVMLGALDLLSDEASAGPVGVIGLSMGAPFALWAARKRPDRIAAVVLFYGTGAAEGGHAAVLGHYAADDPYEPSEQVDSFEDELRSAGRLAAFHRYAGTRHWFAESDRPEFDAHASTLAWARTLAFLRERVRP